MLEKSENRLSQVPRARAVTTMGDTEVMSVAIVLQMWVYYIHISHVGFGAMNK